MHQDANLTIRNQKLTLLAQGAVFWEAQNMLIVADPHFGKAAAFRRSGLAIPAGTTADNLERLEQSLAAKDVRRLLFLGDLMHSPQMSAKGLRQVKHWRNAHPDMNVILVAGNHDRKSIAPPVEFGICNISDRVVLPPFEFVHHPRHGSGLYVLSGHLHPAVALTGKARQREHLPCFYFGRNHAVLPAFGSFTGHSIIVPKRGDKVFVIAENCVVAMNSNYSMCPDAK